MPAGDAANHPSGWCTEDMNIGWRGDGWDPGTSTHQYTMRHHSHSSVAGSSSRVVATSVGTSTSVDSAANLPLPVSNLVTTSSLHVEEHAICAYVISRGDGQNALFLRMLLDLQRMTCCVGTPSPGQADIDLDRSGRVGGRHVPQHVHDAAQQQRQADRVEEPASQGDHRWQRFRRTKVAKCVEV